MKKLFSGITLSVISMSPLLHAADACCPDGGKFDAKPAHGAGGHTHAHGDEGYPRVRLSANQVANLALKTEKITPGKIARTVFALGEITSDPRGESSASSRISGRVVELKVALGDTVKSGDTVAVIESRQPGGEPARIAITAIADGTVDEVLTRLGEPVSPDAPLLRLADHTRLVAIARIPQSAAAPLKPGVTMALISPVGGTPGSAALHSLAPHADPVTGTLTARFFLDNKDGALTPGRRAEYRVILSEKSHEMIVPRGSVHGEKGDLFIFIENAPGIYEKHPVVVVDGDDRNVAITGPSPGELVVTHGGLSLRYADATDTGSMKAALDAAHGHAHGPNGEEPHSYAGKAGIPPAPAHDHDDHDHGEHGHAHGPGGEHLPPEESAAKNVSGKTALQAALDAAHGHAHGPNGEEPHEHTPAAARKTQSTSLFTGDSSAVFFATLAAGEAVLLGLALTALRRKQSKEAPDA